MSDDTPGSSQECLIAVGAVNLDETARLNQPLQPAASNSVEWVRSTGGVIANVIRSSTRGAPESASLTLISAVGNDDTADTIQQTFASTRIETRFQRMPELSSGRYTAILDVDGELIMGLANTEVTEALSCDYLTSELEQLPIPDALVFDSNLSPDVLSHLLLHANATSKIAIAVSPIKAMRLLSLASNIDLVFLNRLEAAMLTGLPRTAELAEYSEVLTRSGFDQQVLTDGPSELLVKDHQGIHQIDVPANDIGAGGVNGLGDALAGATIAAFALKGNDGEYTGDLPGSVKYSGIPAAQWQLEHLSSGLKKN